MLSSLANLWRSRLFKLTVSMLMLTMSVLLFADFFKLRGDAHTSLRDARKSIAEALAVQLTVLAGSSDQSGVDKTLHAFISRSDDIDAIALMRADGTRLAAKGDLERLTQQTESTVSYMQVPIFRRNQPWGEVHVAFRSYPIWPKQLAYFGFIAVSCFVLYLLFLRKALNQLDPSRVVPGRVNHAFNHLSEGVVILDKKLRIMLINDSMAELIGRPAKAAMGQSIDDWPWHRSEDWVSPWHAALESGSFVANEPLELQIDAKTTRKLMVNCAIVGEGEKTQGLLVTMDDMTEIEAKNSELESALTLLKRTQVSIQKKNQELEALATQDPLTGVANRRALLARLENDFQRAEREDRHLSVIMSDIDFFKKINDNYGHVVGDDTIRAVAKTLAEACREYDLVGRYGGEEFLVVLPGLDATQATEIAERMRTEIMQAAAGLPLEELSASLGIADLTSRPDSYMDLIDNADQALYAAKQGGRNRVVVFDAASASTQIAS